MEGLTNSLALALVVGVIVAVAAIMVQNKMTVKKYAGYDFSAETSEPVKK